MRLFTAKGVIILLWIPFLDDLRFFLGFVYSTILPLDERARDSWLTDDGLQ